MYETGNKSLKKLKSVLQRKHDEDISKNVRREKKNQKLKKKNWNEKIKRDFALMKIKKMTKKLSPMGENRQIHCKKKNISFYCPTGN